MKKIKITLIKSIIGQKPNIRKTVKALGLGKINSSIIQEENPVICGMVRTVSHLVIVEDC